MRNMKGRGGEKEEEALWGRGAGLKARRPVSLPLLLPTEAVVAEGKEVLEMLLLLLLMLCVEGGGVGEEVPLEGTG